MIAQVQSKKREKKGNSFSQTLWNQQRYSKALCLGFHPEIEKCENKNDERQVRLSHRAAFVSDLRENTSVTSGGKGLWGFQERPQYKYFLLCFFWISYNFLIIKLDPYLSGNFTAFISIHIGIRVRNFCVVVLHCTLRVTLVGESGVTQDKKIISPISLKLYIIF
jgi:hypothetical protein